MADAFNSNLLLDAFVAATVGCDAGKRSSMIERLQGLAGAQEDFPART